MKFNINDVVRVKLTSRGRQIAHGLGEHPTVETDGWSEWRLWHLCKTFGPFMDMAAPLLFETEIEIEPSRTSRKTKL